MQVSLVPDAVPHTREQRNFCKRTRMVSIDRVDHIRSHAVGNDLITPAMKGPHGYVFMSNGGCPAQRIAAGADGRNGCKDIGIGARSFPYAQSAKTKSRKVDSAFVGTELPLDVVHDLKDELGRP